MEVGVTGMIIWDLHWKRLISLTIGLRLGLSSCVCCFMKCLERLDHLASANSV